jgi:hypothetical protein
MPPPADFRDLPYLMQPGDLAMDRARVEQCLRRARLILGDIDATVPRFFTEHASPPVGFIAFDLGHYTAIKAALRLFDTAPARFLPRVVRQLRRGRHRLRLQRNTQGQFLALREFNAAPQDVKLSPVRGLRFAGKHVPAPLARADLHRPPVPPSHLQAR